MILSAFFAHAAAAAAATGTYTGNQMIFAVDASADKTGEVGTYVVCAPHIIDLGAAIDASTESNDFLYEGKSEVRTGARRTFSISGQRMVGDAFQDLICAHDFAYGAGDAVRLPYVLINAGTGKGEKGICTISVTNDGQGAAGSTATIAASVYADGNCEEYAYQAAAG